MTINGDGQDDILIGTTGDDVINGRGGDDVLLGQEGDDQLNGGSGDDVLIGGDGDDVLSGGADDDVLVGGTGDDILVGGQGDDILLGGSGDDILRGGTGNDIINGGAGNDVLTGGADADTFVFSGDFGQDVITDFSGGDIIDLTAFSGITHLDQLTFVNSGGNTVVTVPGGGSIIVSGASIADVASHIQLACLVRGTMVLTVQGEVPVETLVAGDRVLTVDGSAKPIRWIGRRAYDAAFIGKNDAVRPVVFTAGSLGPDLPKRDLRVSGEHAMFVDHVLVPAELLLNGSSIYRDHLADTVEYFHVELEKPDVIFTDGAPTETYVDHGNRSMFENAGEHEATNRPVGSDDAERPRRFYVVHGGAALAAIRERLMVEASLAA